MAVKRLGNIVGGRQGRTQARGKGKAVSPFTRKAATRPVASKAKPSPVAPVAKADDTRSPVERAQDQARTIASIGRMSGKPHVAPATKREAPAAASKPAPVAKAAPKGAAKAMGRPAGGAKRGTAAPDKAKRAAYMRDWRKRHPGR